MKVFDEKYIEIVFDWLEERKFVVNKPIWRCCGDNRR
jgi:hypothetical protein